MKPSVRKGFSFGLTSGIITTLGLIVGLNSSTSSNIAVLGGVLIIALADALSDAFGVHISEEAENKHTTREIWESTIVTFLSKFFFALTFVIPILVFSLNIAIVVCIGWGFFLITIFSFYLAKLQKTPALKIVFEHLLIAAVVIILTQFIGEWISIIFL